VVNGRGHERRCAYKARAFEQPTRKTRLSTPEDAPPRSAPRHGCRDLPAPASDDARASARRLSTGSARA
jgi:hypothetical protein